MSAETVPCPRCGGQGSTFVFVERVDTGCRAEDWRCRECEGRTYLTAVEARAYWTRKDRGAQMHDARVARRQTLREAAAERGLTIVELSALERGEKPR